MGAVTARTLDWTEAGMVPDSVIRVGIRRLLERKRQEIHADDIEKSAGRVAGFVDMMNRSPIALLPEQANEQHYEVPAQFFDLVLGPQRKYSCCYWGEGIADLAAAESAALGISAGRAEIEDGMTILDLGCGWGSMSLWLAEHFPASRVTGVSNSASQRQHILNVAKARGLRNLEVVTCDMNDFAVDAKFDRVVSIEMFEHMRNYGRLFSRIANWLNDDGRFFMHIFTHRNTPYEFIDKGPSDWMSRHFFTGGIMPSADLPLWFQHHLRLEKRWQWDGAHYARTCNAWLANMDAQRDAVMQVIEATYGSPQAARWRMRWRMFFMACAELFDYRAGQEWFVSHYLFSKQQMNSAANHRGEG